MNGDAWWKWAEDEQPVGTESRFVRDSLTIAGWYPGRAERARVDVWAEELARDASYEGGGCELFPAAREALLEFGGLEYRSTGPGAHFATISFRIDPSLPLGEGDRFDDHSLELGLKLYPLGDVDGGVAFLAIDEQGQVYMAMTELELLAHSMHEAVGCCVLGRRPASRGPGRPPGG